MSIHGTGTFEVKSWDERPYVEAEGGGPKLARATVSVVYHGTLEGEGTLEYLLTYVEPDPRTGYGPGTFVGMEHIVGRLGGRSGSFAVEHRGTFDGTGIKDTTTVVPGSGRGELAGLVATTSSNLEHGKEPLTYTITYDL